MIISSWLEVWFSCCQVRCLFSCGSRCGNLSVQLRPRFSTLSPQRRTNSNFAKCPRSPFALTTMSILSSSKRACMRSQMRIYVWAVGGHPGTIRRDKLLVTTWPLSMFTLSLFVLTLWQIVVLKENFQKYINHLKFSRNGKHQNNQNPILSKVNISSTLIFHHKRTFIWRRRNIYYYFAPQGALVVQMSGDG